MASGVFRGKIMGVREMLEASRDDSPTYVRQRVVTTPSTDAYRCSLVARDLLASGGSLREAWRHGIIQTLDVYFSVKRHSGLSAAREVFRREPVRTGSLEIDAAFAAGAAYVARLDGWDAPEWSMDASRTVDEWFVSGIETLREYITAHTPPEFLVRGVICEERGLHSI